MVLSGDSFGAQQLIKWFCPLFQKIIVRGHDKCRRKSVCKSLNGIGCMEGVLFFLRKLQFDLRIFRLVYIFSDVVHAAVKRGSPDTELSRERKSE